MHKKIPFRFCGTGFLLDFFENVSYNVSITKREVPL